MNDMLEYSVRRLIQGVFVVIAVTALLFLIMQMMPGDPIQLISSPRVSEAKIHELQKQWGLDKPVVVQYFYWFKHILAGDFGTSIISGQPVSSLILQRLPYTIILTGPALVIQFLIAIPLGLWTAFRKDTMMDKSTVILSIVMWSIPSFWLGVLLMLLFSIKLQILPLSGYSGLASLVLPMATLILPFLASTLRLTRSEVLDVLRERFILTAYAKGLTSGKVLTGHVLRNAMIPTTVMFFLSLPWIFGGSVIVESVFAWPGTGRLLWKSIVSQDFPVVQGIIFIIAVLTVLSNTLGDILTALLDPRIRLEMKGEMR